MSTVTAYENPFVGLRAFEEDEDYLFFGRTDEINDLLKKFTDSRLVAVIGSSGSGKSSLVKSGLLPAIYSGYLSVGHNWRRAAVLRPGNDPIGNLSRELAKEGVLYDNVESSGIPYEAIIESTLRRGSNGLAQVYKESHLAATDNLLIVVDQFEELFRFSKYEKQSNQGVSDSLNFINLLLTASLQSECPVYILFTMRSDFLDDCAEFRGLPEAINRGQYLVPRMTRDQIREAITKQVAVSNATISPRLVTRLLNDINNDTDQLPVMQHAMMRTWDAWHNRNQPDTPIDFEDYEKIGAMEAALSQHANEVFDELTTQEEQRICEKMFKALTDKSADSRGTRRPRMIRDLCALTGGTTAEIIKQVEIFRKRGRTFLMPPAGINLSEDTIIDISHESLMRIWVKLKTWTEEEAKSGDAYLRLADSALQNINGDKGLLQDLELKNALKWKEDNNPSAKWAEGFKANFEQTMAYLEKSRIDDLKEQKIQAQKEATRKRLIKVIFGLLGLLVVAGIILSSIFYKSKKKSEQAEKEYKDLHESIQYLKDADLVKDIIKRADTLTIKRKYPQELYITLLDSAIAYLNLPASIGNKSSSLMKDSLEMKKKEIANSIKR